MHEMPREDGVCRVGRCRGDAGVETCKDLHLATAIATRDYLGYSLARLDRRSNTPACGGPAFSHRLAFEA